MLFEFIIATLIMSVPAILLYKFLEKKDWIAAAKGGLLLTALLVLVQFGLVSLIFAFNPDLELGFIADWALDIGIFIGVLYAFKKYFKAYVIKKPVWFYILLKAIYLILTLVMVGIVTVLVITATQSVMSII